MALDVMAQVCFHAVTERAAKQPGGKSGNTPEIFDPFPSLFLHKLQ